MSGDKKQAGSPQELPAELKRTSAEGRIACRDALALAERLGVAPSSVGRAADEAGIKIVDCQLGCFGKRRRRKGRGQA